MMKCNHIKKYSLRYLAYILGANFAAYYGARYLTTDRIHFDISMGFEKAIPFVPEMILVYWGCYLFWAVNYFVLENQEKEKARLFMEAEILGKAICFAVFMIFPTTMTRANICGADIWNQAVSVLYKVDAADNLFPSIHCYTSWMCLLGIKNMNSISFMCKLTVLFISLLICISTLMVKQHVVLDVLGGILIAELSYHLIFRSKGGKHGTTESN